MAAAVKVEVDCAAAGRPDETFARRLFDEAMALQPTEPEKALQLIQEARDTFVASAVSPATVTKLTADELDDLARHRAEAAVLALRDLRAERCRRLAATDYLLLPDITDFGTKADGKAATLDDWHAYRQQLRDWPASVDDPHVPPDWPEPPDPARVSPPAPLLTADS